MPVEVEMINDNRVVWQMYREPLSAADFQKLKEIMERDILPASPHPVHIIADFQGVSNLPNSMLTSGINMMNRAHPNTGVIVCITTNEFVHAMARIFSGVLSRRRVKVVKTFEEAYEQIDALLGETM